MPSKVRKSSEKPVIVCTCVSMHTYDALVKGESWNVTMFVCTDCGQEHFADYHPEPKSSTPKRPSSAKLK
jgi:hypothetical protein